MKIKSVPTYLTGCLFFEVVDTGTDYILSERGGRGIFALIPFFSLLFYKKGYKLTSSEYRTLKESIELRTSQNKKKRQGSFFSRYVPIYVIGIFIFPLLLFGLDAYNILFLKEIAKTSLGICITVIYGLYFYFLKRERKMIEEVIGRPIILSHRIRLVPVNRKTTMTFLSYHFLSILLFLLGYGVYSSFGNILGFLLSLFAVLAYLLVGVTTLKGKLLSVSIKESE